MIISKTIAALTLLQTYPTLHSLAEVFRQLQARFFNEALPRIITGTIVFLIFLIVAHIGRRMIRLAAPRARADTGTVLLLARVYYYGVLTFGALTALSTAGMNVSALITGLGLTGFALGFALKDVLSNLLSGIMLLVYRPFKIGDQIIVSNYEGIIETIRMRDTVMRAFDGRLVVIPNTKLITEIVVNNAGAPFSRETVTVEVGGDGSGIAVNTDVARQTLQRAFAETASLAGRGEANINVTTTKAHTLLLEGRFWLDPRRAERFQLERELENQINKVFGEAGLNTLSVRFGIVQKVNESPKNEDEDDKTAVENQ